MRTLIPILFLVLINSVSFAQIQHFTNIRDGDIDGDGVQDFDIKNEFRWVPTGDSRISVNEGYFFPKNGMELGGTTLYFKDSVAINSNWNSFWKQRLYHHANQMAKIPESWFERGNDFIGIRIKKDDEYYYGWLRRYGNINPQVIEGALRRSPNIPILAGEGISSIKPLTPYCEDVLNSGNFGDLEIHFYAPYFNSYVKEYRIFVMRDNQDINYTADELLDLPENRFTRFSVDLKRLNADVLDVEGNSMDIKNNYKICVLAVSNDTSVFQHAFNISPSISINVELPKVPAPITTDIGNSNNSTDIKVEFVKNPREDMMEEYRLFIVPEDTLYNFSREIAEATDFYHAIITPNDSFITVQNEYLKDVDGNPIRPNILYKSYILSVPDQINANIGSLSNPSNLFCLGKPNYFLAGQREGKHITYFDFNPEMVSRPTNFDIDGDSITDLVFSYYGDWRPSSITDRYSVITRENTEIICENSIAIKLMDNEPINKFRNWGSGKFTLAYEYMSGWSDTKRDGQFFYDGKLGFRKIITNDTIYGWVDIRNLFKVYLREFAWQKNSLRYLPESIPTAFIAYPNPSIERTVRIAIEDFDQEEGYYIDVLNSSAIKMKSIKLNQKLSKIDLTGLPRGIYFIRFRSKDKQETQKIMLL